MSDLSNTVIPGDFINSEGIKWSWDLIDVAAGIIATNGISAAQRDVFCDTIPAKKLRYKDSHTMIYFGSNQLFTVQLPQPTYEDLEKRHGKGDTRIVSVYRMNPAYFGKTLDANDVAIMKSAADEIIAKHKGYDIGQLMDILVSTIAGYPFEQKSKTFDQGNDRLVCSVGCATVIAAWRHKLLQTTGVDIPQPWKVPNPNAFKSDFIKKYPGHWDIQTTFPANYAVTDTHFQNEFILVGRFKGGKRIA